MIAKSYRTISNEEQNLGSDYWDAHFIGLSQEEGKIIPIFMEHIEQYLIISEKLFDSQKSDVIAAIHKILLTLVSHNSKYFRQIELFSNGSVPKHILGKAVIVFLFSEKELQIDMFNKNVKNLLSEIKRERFATKLAFCEIVLNTAKSEKNAFINILSTENLLKLVIFFERN